MNHALFQVSLKLILRNEVGEILAMECGDHLSVTGAYLLDLPGGRINEDEYEEPFASVLEREVREEIGEDVRLQISDVPVFVSRHRFRRKSGEVSVLYVFFDATYLGGEIRVSSEHVGMRWLSPDTRFDGLFFEGLAEGMVDYQKVLEKKDARA